MGEETAPELSIEQRRQQLRRAIVASAIGTAIEWYDFFLYGVAAALVFPRVFFPQSDALTGQLVAFATNFVGFAARPLGAAIFGHYGDRIGRKVSLIATLLLMGVATTAIGLVPGYGSIGIYGAVLLTVFRALQGIGVGGEWGGSVLLAAEWSSPKHRGFVASWPQFGAPAGLVLANGAFYLATKYTGDAFMTWGWRVPFLVSLVLVLIGFYIRVGILETPAFSRARRENRLAKQPLVEVLKKYPREVVLTALLRTGQQTPFYIFSGFVLTYGVAALGFSRGELLRDVILSALLSMVAIPFWGHVSDRLDRRKVIAFGALVMIPWVFVYYALLDTRVAWMALVAIVIAQPLHDIQYGPQAAVIAESFPAHVRYSGASLGYQLASITAGGPAPLVATALYRRYHSSQPIAVYVALCALVSFVSLLLLPKPTPEVADD
ncbi:MAG: MHS family MFS transporter [Deltaproteobacteria bacterium]|nr:MHS family MFS transporter [Deltaproteobacteria bacterium]